MDNSILRSTKKVLGISLDDDSFDLDIIVDINTALSVLQTEGSGLFWQIEDETAEWGHLVSDSAQVGLIRAIVFLRVKILFDPPQTSYLLAAYEEQIKELEWRLNVMREDTNWVDPNPPPIPEEVL